MFTPRTDKIPFSGSRSFGADRSLVYSDLRDLDHVCRIGSVRFRSYVQDLYDLDIMYMFLCVWDLYDLDLTHTFARA